MPDENFEQPINPDFNGSEEAAGPEPSKPEPINRPADGASIANPDDVLGGNFAASESAGDFLGLDTELTAAMAPQNLELSQAPGSQPQGELADQEPVEAQPASLMSSPDAPTEGSLAAGEATEYVDGVEAQGEYDEEYEGEYDDEYDEYDEEFEEAFDEQYEYPAAGTSKLKLIGAFGVGLVVVLGVTVGPGLMSKLGSEAPVEVAEVSQLNPAINPQPAVAVVEQPVVQPVDETPVPAVEPVFEPIVDPEPSQGQGPDVVVEDTGELAIVGSDPIDALPANDPEPVDFEPVSGGAEGLLPEVLGYSSDPLSNLSNDSTGSGAKQASLGAGEFPDFSRGFEWATAAELDMVWRGETIPMEAIQAPARTMMPYVGMVRATLTNGDSLNGRLHALGEGSVWLRDTSNGGLLGLDGSMVTSLERLAVEAGVPLSQNNPEVTSASKRVRVKLLGGTIAGTLVAREGDWVTIRTGSGGTIRLQDPEMEVVTQERVILLRD